MARIINGTLYVNVFTPTGNPGEYTFTGAVYDNQADVTGNGALDVQIGFVLYIPAKDPISLSSLPGVAHRYKITSITSATVSTLTAKILWDERGSEVDAPLDESYCIISEDTINHFFWIARLNGCLC
jgi:hypothetical protein